MAGIENTNAKWLTHFPIPETPDSWALNDLFVGKLLELKSQWAAQGYDWKFGMELEFDVFPPVPEGEHVISGVTDAHFTKYYPAASIIDEHTSIIRQYPPDATIYASALYAVRRFFLEDPDSDLLCAQIKMTKAEALAQIDEIQTRLDSDDAEAVERAKVDAFLAYLHTTPFEDGGLRDIIEPRFGVHEFGLGWYDMLGPEIRTPVLDDPLDVVATYHKFLYVLYSQAPKFGFVLNIFNRFPPQFHVSLWRKSDGVNMMRMEDETAIEFCRNALRGYCETLDSLAFMAHDEDCAHAPDVIEFTAGSSRLSYVRQKTDDWEIRRNQSSGLTHAARHLTLLMAGMYRGCFMDVPEEHRKPVSTNWQPIVTHRFGNHISGLRSTIEHCVINDDNTLSPNIQIIKNNIARMQQEVGEGNLKDLTLDHEEDGFKVEFDLNHHYAWEELIKKVKFNGRGQLDTSDILDAPELCEALAALEIHGKRPVLNLTWIITGNAPHKYHEGIALAFQDGIMADLFSDSEQTRIIGHYPIAPQRILARHAGMLVEDFIGNFTLRKKIESDPEGYSDDFTDVYIDRPSDHFDSSIFDVTNFLVLADDTRPCPRSMFTSQKTYAKSLKAEFNKAAARYMAENDPETNTSIPPSALATLTDYCDRLISRPPNAAERIQTILENRMGMVRGLCDFIHGLTDEPPLNTAHLFHEAVHNGPETPEIAAVRAQKKVEALRNLSGLMHALTMEMMQNFLSALRDPAYETGRLRADIADLATRIKSDPRYAAMEDETLKNEPKWESIFHSSLLAAEVARSLMLTTIGSLEEWTRDKLIDDLPPSKHQKPEPR